MKVNLPQRLQELSPPLPLPLFVKIYLLLNSCQLTLLNPRCLLATKLVVLNQNRSLVP